MLRIKKSLFGGQLLKARMDTSGAGGDEVSLMSVGTPQDSLSESVDSEAAGKVCAHNYCPGCKNANTLIA